jgi:hypothetical protein
MLQPQEGTMEPIPKRRGPKPKGLKDTRIKVQPHLIEWAKEQPGGFAATVRSLLEKAYARHTRTPARAAP